MSDTTRKVLGDWAKIAAVVLSFVTVLVQIARWTGRIEANQDMASWQMGEVSKQVAVVSDEVKKNSEQVAVVSDEVKKDRSITSQAAAATARAVRIINAKVTQLEKSMKETHVHIP